MNKTDFIQNFLEYSKNEGFSFLSPGDQFTEPEKMSGGKQALMAGILGAGISAVFGGGAITGAIAGSNVGYSGHSKEELIADLKSMNQYCDLVGMSTKNGACVVRPVIDADEIPYETLVGRFAMMHERLHTFRKYSMVIVKNWIWGDSTAATVAQVLVLFSSHKKAKDFVQQYADKCKHRTVWKSIFTVPFVVDLEDEDLTILNLGLIKQNPDKYKPSFFKKRML